MKLQNREKIRLLKAKILPLLNIVGLLAQSAERGADNAKVMSSTLTRTTEIMFFFYLTFSSRNLISADKSVIFCSFFKVTVGIYLNQNHSVHIPHPKNTGMMSPWWWNETPKPRENSVIKPKNSATLNIAGPLAQSAERGADNAKVVSSTLTRTTERIFFFYLTFSLRNPISADKSVLFFFSFLRSWLVFT